jgi:hypothetical protein
VVPLAGPELPTAQPSTIPRDVQVRYRDLRARVERPTTVAAAKRIAQEEITKIEQQYPDVAKPYDNISVIGRPSPQATLDSLNSVYERFSKMSDSEVNRQCWP